MQTAVWCPVRAQATRCPWVRHLRVEGLGLNLSVYQDPPCTLNWGYMFPNSGYLGPNRR